MLEFKHFEILINFYGSISSKYKQIGNAVPYKLLAKFIGKEKDNSSKINKSNVVDL